MWISLPGPANSHTQTKYRSSTVAVCRFDSATPLALASETIMECFTCSDINNHVSTWSWDLDISLTAALISSLWLMQQEEVVKH